MPQQHPWLLQTTPRLGQLETLIFIGQSAQHLWKAKPHKDGAVQTQIHWYFLFTWGTGTDTSREQIPAALAQPSLSRAEQTLKCWHCHSSKQKTINPEPQKGMYEFVLFRKKKSK